MPAQKAYKNVRSLRYQGRGSSRLVFPVRGQNLASLVIAGESVNTRLDQNQSEFSILVLAVLLEVLADSDGLLNEEIQVLGDLGSESVGAEDTHNLAARDILNLGNAVAITEDHADLRRSETLLGELRDVLDHLLRGNLQPLRGSSLVGQSRVGNTLTSTVHATHLGWFLKEQTRAT